VSLPPVNPGRPFSARVPSLFFYARRPRRNLRGALRPHPGSYPPTFFRLILVLRRARPASLCRRFAHSFQPGSFSDPRGKSARTVACYRYACEEPFIRFFPHLYPAQGQSERSLREKINPCPPLARASQTLKGLLIRTREGLTHVLLTEVWLHQSSNPV